MITSISQRVSPSIDAVPVLQRARRPAIRGKFLYVGEQKLPLHGVTYGPFRPTEDGCEYHTPDQVDRDFERMAAHGLNTVRLYTVPPRWLLDIAAKHGLRLLIGLPWEQHITFLRKRATARSIVQRVREGVRSCADHPAVLGFAVGNEIPASIVRWYGRQRIERFIRRLYRAVKQEDPAALVTYVNFPTTEYLELPFLDFLCFNVYLEDEQTLRRYLSRLQNLAGDRPLVMGEVGLDSRRNGVDEQARTLHWQIRACLGAGCAGVYTFAWTDEWHRGGFDIEDWDFGLTTRDREPKPALASVARAFGEGILANGRDLPRVSVVVCTYNGSKTIRQTCDHLAKLDYPDYEVLVIDDGSNDGTGAILDQLAEEYPLLRVVHKRNGGLSTARNVGLREATGQIVAYIDDDAYPDPDWLNFAVHHLLNTNHVGVGGPNLPVPEDGKIPTCVAHSPGGPNHVLLSDRTAEHIPGCNMVFWKGALDAAGGFDPQFRIAGDDVDLCWRLQERDGVIGFHPTALVWHHRRGDVRGYLRQQTNYGKAEAMLQRKWPSKYNQFGHVQWSGRLYGQGVTLPLAFRRHRIYHGVWGTGLFQSMYQRPASLLQSIPLMPEWYLLSAAVMLVAMPGILWQPLWFLAPLLGLAIGIPILQAAATAASAELDRLDTRWERLKCRAIIAAMHLAQPLARLKGRLAQGLAPWRRSSSHRRMALPRIRSDAFWSEHWKAPEQRLAQLEQALLKVGVHPIRGGDYDRWDLEVFGGMFGSIRLLMAIEEHGGGAQLVRIHARPRIGLMAKLGLAAVALLLAFSAAMFHVGAVVLLTVLGVSLLVRAFGDCASAMGAYFEVTRHAEDVADAALVSSGAPAA